MEGYWKLERVVYARYVLGASVLAAPPPILTMYIRPTGACANVGVKCNMVINLGWSYFHKEFLMEEEVSGQEEELENLLNETMKERLKEQETWLPKCKQEGVTDDPRIPTSLAFQEDPISIYFDVSEASQQDRASYSRMVNNDLKV
jgi:hypothetical protein